MFVDPGTGGAKKRGGGRGETKKKKPKTMMSEI